jgi:hypothetical protein
MAKSIKQLQDESLAFLDGLAANQEYELAKLGGIDKYLLGAAKTFLDRAKDNIIKQGLVSSGDLLSDLTFEFEAGNNTYTISIGYPKESKAAEYYDYVNKGVRGYVSGSPNSRYKFNSPYPSKKMALSILKWTKKLTIREKYDANVNKTKFGKKRASVTKMVDEAKSKKKLAYAIASSIKKKGIKKSRFFDDALDFTFGQEFVNGLAKIYGKQIGIVIKSTFNGNNNQ